MAASSLTVQLRGSAEALLARNAIELDAAEHRTVRSVLNAVAERHPGLARQLLREDGTPRRYPKFLIDGRPVTSYDAEIPKGAAVSVVPALPCDG